MKPLFTRARMTAGLGALALSAGMLAGPATAARADVYTPSPADFTDCPAIPAGAVPLLWNCLSITLTDGEIKLGGFTQQITKPIRITVAVGYAGGSFQLIGGGLDGDSMEVPADAFPLPGLSLAVEQAATPTPGPILPVTLPVKLHISHLLVGSTCYIGSDDTPIVLKPNLSGLNLEQLGGEWVIRTQITENQFAVPAATGCGLILTPLLNTIAGLPSASGQNSATLNTVLRVRNYQLGQTTQSFAAAKNIK